MHNKNQQDLFLVELQIWSKNLQQQDRCLAGNKNLQRPVHFLEENKSHKAQCSAVAKIQLAHSLGETKSQHQEVHCSEAIRNKKQTKINLHKKYLVVSNQQLHYLVDSQLVPQAFLEMLQSQVKAYLEVEVHSLVTSQKQNLKNHKDPFLDNPIICSQNQKEQHQPTSLNMEAATRRKTATMPKLTSLHLWC